MFIHLTPELQNIRSKRAKRTARSNGESYNLQSGSSNISLFQY
jgi:hypothetical protein